jgi:hypothetical protein
MFPHDREVPDDRIIHVVAHEAIEATKI